MSRRGIVGAVTTHGAPSHDTGPALPTDYDGDPGRFAANQAAIASFSRRGDVHASVARRLADAGCGLVLDVGGGMSQTLLDLHSGPTP